MSNEKFLERFDKATQPLGGQERALYLLLKLSENYLPPIGDSHWFHKSFRQTDVTPSAEIDMAIWHLLGTSQEFWRIAEKFKDPS